MCGGVCIVGLFMCLMVKSRSILVHDVRRTVPGSGKGREGGVCLGEGRKVEGRRDRPSEFGERVSE